MSPTALPRKPRVYCLYPIEPAQRAYASSLFDFVGHDEPGVEEWYDHAEGLMVRNNQITAEDVARVGTQLRFVGKHGVGMDNIAVKDFEARGVLVMNTPGVNATAVAELAMGLTLTLARNIPSIDRRIRAGETVTKADGGTLGFQLTGRPIGIIGGGNIGSRVAKMFHAAFDSEVYLYDPFLTPEAEARLASYVPPTHLRRVATIAEMVPLIDVLTVHVPLQTSTRGLVGEAELKGMKSTALLINTARGGVVDEAALGKALKLGWIAGAGIDAWADEPPTLGKYASLVNNDRVVSTPHIGAASPDVVRTTVVSVIDHIADAFAGRPRDHIRVPT